MQQNLKKIILFCLCAIPFLAWVVSDGRLFDINFISSPGLFFPFITGKNFGFRVLVEIALVAWTFLALRHPEYRPRKSGLLIAYSVFIVVLFVADLFGVDSFRSFFSNYERMEGFVTHLHLYLYFVMLISMVRSKEEWHKMLNVFLASNACVLLWGYLQLLGSSTFFLSKFAPSIAASFSKHFPIHMSDSRLDSTLGNSAYFAIYCAVFLGIAGIMYLNATRKGWRVTYGLLALLNLIALYYTATRGTMLGLITGIFVGCFWVALFSQKRERKIALSICGGMIAVVLVFISIKNTDFVKTSPVLSRFAAISSTETTTLSRLTLWKMSYEGFKAKPILGYGQDNFGYVFAHKYDPIMYDQEPWFDRSHNVFFDWLMAAGIVGLLSYLSLFVAAFYMLFKRRGDMSLREQALIIGILVTYFVHNVLVFDNLVSYVLFFALLAYIAKRAAVDHSKGHVDMKDYRYILEPIVVLSVLVVFWYGVYKPYIANVTLIKALNPSRFAEGTPLDAMILDQLSSFEQALSYNSFGSLEIREQMIQTAERIVSLKPQFPTETEKNAFIQAASAFLGATKKHIDEAPETERNDARELSLYSSFFNTAGDYKEGERYALLAHDISPKKQRISFVLILSYLGQGKTKEAYALALQTYLDAPSYQDAQTTLAVTAVYAGVEKETMKIFTDHGQTFPLTGEVINAYINLGKLDQAIALLQQYKKLHPEETANVDQVLKGILDKRK